MTIMVPNVGEELALKNFLNHTAPQNQTLKLFQNNITPAETDTAVTYTECAITGYSAKSLTGTSWTVTAGAPSDAAYAEQTWTFTAGFGATVYGYFVVQTTSGILMWAERDASPYTPANNGDQIKLTPALTCD